MPKAENRRGAILIDIARRELDQTIGGLPDSDEAGDRWRDQPWLFDPGAVFVTLLRNGALRGCVGSLFAVRPLIEEVRHNAIAAAQRDNRFSPVRPDELSQLEVEVTELSPPEPIRFTSEADALAQLRPGKDGIVLRWGGHRATFLPQVWDSLPEPKTFLAHLKRKAGLNEDFWDDTVELERYAARKWSS